MKTSRMSSFGATSSKSRLRAPLLGAVIAAIVLIAGYAIYNPPRVAATYLDFDAFYCGARILAAGDDPYRYEPLHACEVANLRAATPNAVVPAPLPPYGLAAFVPISRLAYARAQFLWWLVLVAGGVVVLFVVVETTGLPLLVAAAFVLLGVLLPSLIVGSLALLPTALLTLSALALSRKRWTVATLLQAAACIEPHVALPVLLTTFFVVPAMRWRLACAGAAILALSIVAGHAALNSEYLARVLPAHSLSEIGNAEQYGLSAILHVAGLAERTSVWLANVQYALFFIAGLWLVHRLRSAMPESIVFVPMALAVTGGPFVHLTQLGAAIPLALVVAVRRDTTVAWAGVTLLAAAIPWQASIGFGGGIAAIVLLAVLLYRQFPWPAAFTAAAVAGAALTYAGMPELLRHQTIVLAAVSPSALAEIPWRELADQFPPTPFSWLGHALIYAGLACTYWSTVLLARNTTRA